jgi:DNA-binding HxlR family transcriptional regulator
MNSELAHEYRKIGIQQGKCEVRGIWQVITKRWSLLILKNLNTKEVIRFNELKKVLLGISSTVLSKRLYWNYNEKVLLVKKFTRQFHPE